MALWVCLIACLRRLKLQPAPSTRVPVIYECNARDVLLAQLPRADKSHAAIGLNSLSFGKCARWPL